MRGLAWVLVSMAGGCFGCAGEASRPLAPTQGIATCEGTEGCRAAVALAPADPHLRVLWGRELEEASMATMAAREFRGALRLAQDPSDPVDEAARGLIRLGDAAGCVSLLDEQLAGQRSEAFVGVLRQARRRCEDAAQKTW